MGVAPTILEIIDNNVL